jgi:hypothetical protein
MKDLKPLRVDNGKGLVWAVIFAVKWKLYCLVFRHLALRLEVLSKFLEQCMSHNFSASLGGRLEHRSSRSGWIHVIPVHPASFPPPNPNTPHHLLTTTSQGRLTPGVLSSPQFLPSTLQNPAPQRVVSATPQPYVYPGSPTGILLVDMFLYSSNQV